MKEEERFSGIKDVVEWLFRGRRTSNVSPATELEPPAEQGLLNKTVTPVSEGLPKILTGREKRRLRMVLYDF